MPGAFAHLTAANLALVTPNIDVPLPIYCRRVLSQYQRYVELGSVSPDFPYLALTNTEQSKWADKMHRKYVDVFLKLAIYHVKSLQGTEQDVAYAWLSGYLSHVIADITIHPVIERTVGPYLQNKQAHRKCEMHQDTYIWQRMAMGEIGTKSWLTTHLMFCTTHQSTQIIDPIVTKVWQESLELAFPTNAIKPDINGWFTSFLKVIALVEDDYHLFPLSRHVASFLNLTYPKVNELNPSYLKHLPTPKGAMEYDQIFDRCLKHIVDYQLLLYRSVFEDHPLHWVEAWSLDTGLCANGTLSAWEHILEPSDPFTTHQEYLCASPSSPSRNSA